MVETDFEDTVVKEESRPSTALDARSAAIDRRRPRARRASGRSEGSTPRSPTPPPDARRWRRRSGDPWRPGRSVDARPLTRHRALMLDGVQRRSPRCARRKRSRHLRPGAAEPLACFFRRVVCNHCRKADQGAENRPATAAISAAVRSRTPLQRETRGRVDDPTRSGRTSASAADPGQQFRTVQAAATAREGGGGGTGGSRGSGENTTRTSASRVRRNRASRRTAREGGGGGPGIGGSARG